MKRKYLYYSKYKINGLECHEFDEIIIPINHEWVREVYIYKEKYEVFIEFELKNKRNNKEGSELEKDCEVLIQKLLYRLYVKDAIWWKVRNVGEIAERKNEIRGQIEKKWWNYKTEDTMFGGPHFVECYVIKNGECVAMQWIQVHIGEASI